MSSDEVWDIISVCDHRNKGLARYAVTIKVNVLYAGTDIVVTAAKRRKHGKS